MADKTSDEEQLIMKAYSSGPRIIVGIVDLCPVLSNGSIPWCKRIQRIQKKTEVSQINGASFEKNVKIILFVCAEIYAK